MVGGHSLSNVVVNSDITLPSDGNINFIIFMLLSMLNRTSSTFHKRDREMISDLLILYGLYRPIKSYPFPLD